MALAVTATRAPAAEIEVGVIETSTAGGLTYDGVSTALVHWAVPSTFVMGLPTESTGGMDMGARSRPSRPSQLCSGPAWPASLAHCAVPETGSSATPSWPSGTWLAKRA